MLDGLILYAVVKDWKLERIPELFSSVLALERTSLIRCAKVVTEDVPDGGRVWPPALTTARTMPKAKLRRWPFNFTKR